MSDLETRIGHSFNDPSLLTRALTHSSANSTASNERLEFLGDRVLGLVVAEMLSKRFPNDAEGALSVKLHALVRRESCAKAAEAVGLGSHINAKGAAPNMQVLADAIEALIGALYLDGGLDVTRRFIETLWLDQFSGLSEDMRDAKTKLQVWAHEQGRDEPKYREVSRSGSDHAPRFEIEVSIMGYDPMVGEGRSKREAEHDAAKKMLLKFGLL